MGDRAMTAGSDKLFADARGCLELHPRALILRHVLGRMLMELCHGVQLRQSSSLLRFGGGPAGTTQALP